MRQNWTVSTKEKLTALVWLNPFGPSSDAVVLQNFSCYTGTFACAALHKALPASRAVLACEVDRPLANSLVTTKEGILPHAPARVASEKIGIARGVTQCCLSCVVSADARKDALQLLKAILSILLDFFRLGHG